MKSNDNNGYVSIWNKKPVVVDAPRFTELELAIMEGGHSAEQPKVEKFSFIKTLSKNTLP